MLKSKVRGGVSRHAIALHVKLKGTLEFRGIGYQNVTSGYLRFKIEACTVLTSALNIR